MRSKVVGTGLFVPKTIITNQKMAEMFGEPIKSNLEEKLGIKQRYVTNEDESSADLATGAAIKAIEDAGLTSLDIDLIIVASDTPEYISPATAVIVQGRMGAINAGIFDINSSCAGFVTAVEVATGVISKGPYKNVLVIGVYNMTKYIDKSDMNLFSIFADGAGAIILQATEEERGLIASKLVADGTQYDYIGIYCGGTKKPITKERVENKEHLLTILKPLPGDRNVKLWPGLVKDTLERANLTYSDIDHILFSQINKSVIQEVMEIIGLPMEKTTCIMGEYGYTGSACIPMAINVAIKNKTIKDGDIVVLVASGAGLSVACTVFRW